MSDVPTVKPVDISGASRDLFKVTQAVHEGIATHAEKHRATLHAAHARREAQLRLEAKPVLPK